MRTNIIVRLFVSYNVRNMGKRFSASAAHIGFFLAVRSFVYKQIVSFVKLLITFFTAESPNHTVVPFYVFLTEK